MSTLAPFGPAPGAKAAREAALAQLIGGLADDELSDLRELAREMNQRRRK